MSRRQFFRMTKQETGLTPNQFVQEIRLQKARQLLESKEKLSIKEITFAVGLQKPSYFSFLFKKRFGISPSEYMTNSK